MKSYFARPRELTGAIGDPWGGEDGAGAGFAGGFCEELCAKAGESGPAIRSAAINVARKDLATSKSCRLAPLSKPACLLFAAKKRFLTRPHRVVMTIFIPRGSVPVGRILFKPILSELIVWNVP